MDRRFYVYEFIRLDTGEPFYIGKGCGNRVNDIHRGRSKWFKNIVKKHGAVSRIIIGDLTESEAYEAEVWFIYEYKHILNYKIANLDDGGHGATNGKSNPMYGRRGKLSPIYGRQKPLIERLNISQGLKGKKKSEKHKQKLKEHCQGRNYRGENNPNYGNGIKISGGNNPASVKIIAVGKTGESRMFDTKHEACKFFGISPYLLNKFIGKTISVDEDFVRLKNDFRHLDGYKLEVLNEPVTTSRKTYTIS